MPSRWMVDMSMVKMGAGGKFKEIEKRCQLVKDVEAVGDRYGGRGKQTSKTRLEQVGWEGNNSGNVSNRA